MDTASQSVNPPQPIVFRGKKRKTYRQRTSAEGEEASTTATVDPVPDTPSRSSSSSAINTQLPNPVPTTIPDDEGKDEALSISEALRLRNARKSRLRGVTFAANNNGSGNNAQIDAAEAQEDELTLMIREEEKKVMERSITAANKRFAPQTGLSGEIVNKHMEQFIEAEITKRHSMASDSRKSQASSQHSNKTPQNEATAGMGEGKHTAFIGKLFEVDLGDEVRSRNEAMTDRARRKLQGLAVDDEDDKNERPKKVRLGKDGKPWRPKNRRNSDDIKRDQLVEEILRESKLDVYETPTPPVGEDPGKVEEGAADDRIAEQFRREFLDAMAERHRRRKPAGSSSKSGAKKDEEILRGPKLGGSRNTRAAMRDLLLKKEREKDGKK